MKPSTYYTCFKQPIITLLLVVLCNMVVSQSYFSKILPGWENTNFIETDSSYISFGMNNRLFPYKNFIQISKINKISLSNNSHDIFIDSNTQTQLRSYSSENVLKTKHNTYLIGDQFTTKSNGLILKLNPNFDSISSYSIDTTYFDSRYFVIKQKEKNKFIILGDYNLANDKSNTFLKIIDSAGSTIWTKSYTIPFKNIHLYPKDIVETSDGGFLLLCEEQEPWLQQIGRSIVFYRPTLIKTDSLGNEQWRKTLGDYRYNNYATNIIKAEDDTSYFVSWYNQDSIMYQFGLVANQWATRYNVDATTHFSRIGESGSTIWLKTYKELNDDKTPVLPRIDCMIKDIDNKIVIGGAGGSEVNFGSAIGKFTQQGELIWYRRNIQLPDTVSYPQSFTIMKTLKQTSDGGFIFGGEYRYNVLPYSSHAYIIKLDQYGCMEPGCHLQDQWYLDSIADAKNKSNKEKVILLYPNPTNGEITIKLPASFSLKNPVAVSIVNSLGKQVNEFQLTDYTTNHNVSDLAKGMYFFNFYNQELGNEVIKVVVN